jgi:DNA-binding NarL/FixJ family response regulator
MHTNYSSSRLVGDAFKAGATGYLIKPATLSVLCEAIRAVASSEVFLCDQLAAVPGLPDAIKHGMIPPIPLEVFARNAIEWTTAVAWLHYELPLSFTEAACAFEAYQGRSKKQIASVLGCAESTIASHFEDVYGALRSRRVTNVASLSRLVGDCLRLRPRDWKG